MAWAHDRPARPAGDPAPPLPRDATVAGGGLLAAACGARRVLEFGTLAGYSTIHLARAVGEGGWVTTLELDPGNASVASASFERVGVADRIEVVVGPATESAQRLIEAGTQPYDLVFIDADKPSNPAYLAAALQLTRPGALIVVDNVVRNGAVADPTDPDPRVLGVRQLVADVAANPGLQATAVQTVGIKGWDGLLIARRR